jgi:hypothetical protein
MLTRTTRNTTKRETVTRIKTIGRITKLWHLLAQVCAVSCAVSLETPNGSI